MSCKNCERAFETKEIEYYFKIGVGTILVYGCGKHICELQRKIRG